MCPWIPGWFHIQGDVLNSFCLLHWFGPSAHGQLSPWLDCARLYQVAPLPHFLHPFSWCIWHVLLIWVFWSWCQILLVDHLWWSIWHWCHLLTSTLNSFWKSRWISYIQHLECGICLWWWYILLLGRYPITFLTELINLMWGLYWRVTSGSNFLLSYLAKHPLHSVLC